MIDLQHAKNIEQEQRTERLVAATPRVRVTVTSSTRGTSRVMHQVTVQVIDIYDRDLPGRWLLDVWCSQHQYGRSVAADDWCSTPAVIEGEGTISSATRDASSGTDLGEHRMVTNAAGIAKYRLDIEDATAINVYVHAAVVGPAHCAAAAYVAP